MNPLSHRKQIILPLLVTVVLGCFALPSATQAVPLPSNVNVVNTPNVNVVNPTTQPVPVRDVDNPARQPFQVQVVGDFADGASTTGDIPITTVPAGKLLVIEYVSLFGSMLTGQQLVRARLQTGNPPVYSELRFNIQGGNVEVTRDYFVGSQFYAQPGPISCFAERNSTAGANPASVTFTVSGYFVDCPTCAP